MAATTGARVIGFGPAESFEPDERVGEGWTLHCPGHTAADDLTLRALHTPGHASDHLCWLVEEHALLLTGDPDKICTLPCNPSIGGSAKGQLVREIDALGGAMAQAADEEPSLRSLFRELADGIVSRLRQLLENLHLDATDEQVKLMHSLSVGLAVVDLATQRPHSKRRVEAILQSLFAMFASKDRK